MPKKQKITKIQSLKDNHDIATTHSVFNMVSSVKKDSKVQEKDVFEGIKKKPKAKAKPKAKPKTKKKY
tara:strand:+ start:257 stop:460 length:204 start_codon:yes stop_codon:yes gene_type:complete